MLIENHSKFQHPTAGHACSILCGRRRHVLGNFAGSAGGSSTLLAELFTAAISTFALTTRADSNSGPATCVAISAAMKLSSFGEYSVFVSSAKALSTSAMRLSAYN